METYGQRMQAERKQYEETIANRKPKYDYTVAGKKQQTTSPAIAARYDAQLRYFGMSKFRRVVARVTGQKRKFDKLWLQAGNKSIEKDQQVADELSKMFR